MYRKECLYDALVLLGGRVGSQGEWRSLVQRCGYSARSDAAGFFGGRRPSLVCLPDGSRVLTKDGWRRAKP
jgi:hypothetical protein